MSSIDREISAMRAAFDALAPLPAKERRAALQAVREELEVRDIAAAAKAAKTLDLIEDTG